jgi:V/A-type H+-transporting ATPase subunit I
MILEMKKVSLICLASEKVHALEALRELGVMHVELDGKNDSPDFSRSEQFLSSTSKAINTVSGRKGKQSYAFSGMSGEELVRKIEEITDTNSNLVKKLDSLVKDWDKVRPWGEFSSDLFEELREKGVYVYLCAGNKNTLLLLPAGTSYRIISQEKGKLYFAVTSNVEQEKSALPTVVVPMGKSLREFDNEINECRYAIQNNEESLDSLSCEMNKLKIQQIKARETIEFITSRDSMKSADTISYINGFIPTHLVERTRAAAKQNGWGLLITDPHHDDRVPTLIQVPKIFQISKPIFDVIGIAPSYHEVDISVCFLFFLYLFVGILIGDAGYALLLFAILGVAKILIKSEKARLPINLLFVMGSSIFIWGFLTGSWFGIEIEKLPGFLHPNPWFKNEDNLRYCCFIIAALHLSIAHIWIGVLKINRIGQVIGQIGWVLFIWGNFFLASSLVAARVFPHFAYYFFIFGFIMMLFSINYKDIGDVCGFPFAILSSFVDLLSYIRLFAVGLSGLYVAENFNKMAAGTLDLPYVGLTLGIIIIVFGHSLNIMLGALAVLVHGIRLNTLEFSGQLGLHWSGFLYRPFKKMEIDENLK